MKFPIIRQAFKHPSVSVAVAKAKQYIDEHKDDPNINFMHFCPYCGAPLEATNRKEKLESLSEHVLCGDPTIKTVFKCSAHCEFSETSKWDYEGGMYYDFPKETNDEDREKLWVRHNDIQKICFGAKHNFFPCDALGSTSYISSMEVYTPIKKKEFPVRLFKNQKHVPVICRHYKFDNFGKALSVKWFVKYRLYTSNNSYTLWNPWHKQLIDCIKTSKQEYLKWLNNPSFANLSKLYGIDRRHKTLDDRKGFEKIYYKHIVPFVFGKLMGIVYNHIK